MNRQLHLVMTTHAWCYMTIRQCYAISYCSLPRIRELAQLRLTQTSNASLHSLLPSYSGNQLMERFDPLAVDETHHCNRAVQFPAHMWPFWRFKLARNDLMKSPTDYSLRRMMSCVGIRIGMAQTEFWKSIKLMPTFLNCIALHFYFWLNTHEA